jgi:hypothetical protein
MHQIRKTAVAIKGGPGGVGVFYDKDDKQVHLHDGTTDRVVEQRVAGLTAKTAAFTVTFPEDNGKIFEMELLTGMDVVLPAVSSANKGMRVTLVNALLPTSNVYKVSPASGDRIGYLADDAELQNTAATDVLGDLVTLESDGVDGWIVINKIGIWAVV